MSDIAAEGVGYPFTTEDETWSVSWHSPPTPPDGIRHGSAGVCVTPQGTIILVSQNGIAWDLPGGRPEGTETWEETLRREMAEEACVTPGAATLLGFARAVCVEGAEAGRQMVRAFWRVAVTVAPWDPQFEITHRRLIHPKETLRYTFTGYAPIYRRVLQEAGLPYEA